MPIAAEQLEVHRAALTGHCYRMMGSATDAEDAAQETLVRAWKNLDRFDGRALRAWLYRIATNVCLDLLEQRPRRFQPMELGPAGTIEGPFDQLPRATWIEPVADARAIPSDSNPAEAAEMRQSIQLAFVTALQQLPPKPRAALLLTEVLGWTASEVAEALDTSVASVNSALQRARATLSRREAPLAPLSAEQRRLVDRYVDAFLRFDVDALAALLRDDAVLSMPPLKLWLQGAHTIRAWLLGPGGGCRGSRLVPIHANGGPAFGQYRPDPAGGYAPWAVVVLELSGDRIAALRSFLDTETLFPLFGLAPHLPAHSMN